MGRRSRNRGQQPIKGFRPGKEPPHLRKQRAKAQLGKDASWAQKQMVEVIGDRSPDEVHALMKRWTTVLLVAVLILVAAGLFLYTVAIWAGVIVHVLAIGVGVLWFRVRHQLVTFAEALGRGGTPVQKRGK